MVGGQGVTLVTVACSEAAPVRVQIVEMGTEGFGAADLRATRATPWTHRSICLPAREAQAVAAGTPAPADPPSPPAVPVAVSPQPDGPPPQK